MLLKEDILTCDPTSDEEKLPGRRLACIASKNRQIKHNDVGATLGRMGERIPISATDPSPEPGRKDPPSVHCALERPCRQHRDRFYSDCVCVTLCDN